MISSTIPQTAFLPSLPLTPTTLLLRRTPIPSIRNPSLPSTSPTRRPFRACTDTSDIHDSWRVYTKPGNNCVICSGHGSTKCLFCFGEGQVRVGPEAGRDSVTCPHCEGRGRETCLRCDGSGIRPDTRIDENGAVIPNLTNEQVCLLPLDDYETDSVAEVSERGTDREVASNGVAAS